MSHFLRRLGTAVLAAGTLAAGLGATGAAAPAQAAAGISSLGQVDCAAASRMAQIRGNGSELWLSSIARADSDKPTLYGWQRIYAFNEAASAVAIISTEDSLVRMLVSLADGGLRSYTWNTATRTMVVKNLTPDAADKKYDFRRLTFDGTRLYGNKGTELYVMTTISTTAAPKAMAKVNGYNGYARSFFGNASTPDGELSWTDTGGTLRIGDVSHSQDGWSLTSRATSGNFPEHTITSPGGGILLRDLPTGALWRHHLDTDKAVVASHTTLAESTNAPDLPVTTDPTVCKGTTTVASVMGGQITRAEVLKRSQYWLDKQVPYSQTASYRDPEGDQYYRTDCSGYVSMSWHAEKRKDAPGADHWTGSLYQITTPVAWDALKPGDAVNNAAQHVVLFVRWADASKSTMVLREHYSTPLPPRETTRTVSYLEGNGFEPIRYDNIVD